METLPNTHTTKKGMKVGTLMKTQTMKHDKVQEIKNQLKELYPNKVVTSISTHNQLYASILKLSKSHSLSVSEFIEHLGFKSKIQIKTIKSIEECLLEIYPDKMVKRLKGIDSNLYDRIKKYAKQNKKTIEQYLNELGFVYKRSDGNYKKINLENELRNIYPNGIVFNVYKESPVLYQKLYRIANRNRTTIQSVLEQMGFEYNHVERDFRSIQECLKELYPHGTIANLIEVDNKLYKRIHKECVVKKIKVKDFVETLGFKYLKYNKSG